MILQALKDYYDRKAADPASGIAPEGWEWKEVSFIIVLNRQGSLLEIEDTREGEGNKKHGKLFLVPLGEKKSSGIKANLLWDTPNYVFGVGDSRGEDQKTAFIYRIEKEVPENEKRNAVLSFLSNIDIAALEKTSSWTDILEKKPNISIRFDDELELYCQNSEIKSVLLKKSHDLKPDGLCLVTGEMDKISVLHTAIKGVWGAQSSGANIISFHLHAFWSFGKERGYNAPVGEKAMFAYTTALNTLLSRDSKQRMQIGDTSTVFWSAGKTQFEEDFLHFFNEPPQDDPDASSRCIKNLFDSPRTGSYIEDPDDQGFFVLGLGPNAARISIRFWKAGTIGEFAKNIRQHFEDTSIIKPKNEPTYYSLWRLLVNTAIQDKSENIPPNIEGDFMRAILDGTPYPMTLLQLVLRRIKSDTENRVKPVRAALIKAYLNRYLRFHENPNEKELSMELDTDQPSQGYQLGRLFAVLEKIQEDAGLSGIRERYYGAACGAPVTVFPTLMRLKNHHLAKIERDHPGWVINSERLIGEILKYPFNDFPAHFSLHEQGKFAIGYYHQRQDFFVSKKDKGKE
jgi:CRISPR-associated protein Csd1